MASQALAITTKHHRTHRFPVWVFQVMQRYMTRQTINPGTFLWREGDASDALVLVLNGTLVAQKETGLPNYPLIMGLFTAGALVGEEGFIDSLTCTMSIQAKAASDLLILRKQDFDLLEQGHPLVANLILKELLDVVSTRLRHTQKRLSAIV